MRNDASAKDGITKAEAHELFDKLFEEQKTAMLRADEMNEKVDT